MLADRGGAVVAVEADESECGRVKAGPQMSWHVAYLMLGSRERPLSQPFAMRPSGAYACACLRTAREGNFRGWFDSDCRTVAVRRKHSERKCLI